MNARLRAYVISIILLGLVVSPLFGAFSGDSFPISTYPMFATTRSSDVKISHVMLVDATGAEWSPAPSAIANDEVLQAQETVRQALEAGEPRLSELCERIASRVAYPDAVQVRIVTSVYDARRYKEGELEVKERQVHASCEVST